ncbi:hypothetical protein LLEC1_04431 [Akanthomyces lecanii]|uniref:Heterokaryon incompatibility domain-containing protein n=1 Tax=Cordyceps confragosa TaxID=2714763 RepID=A0A179IVH9_CORDF|nr:hypothetical protein LLEC1_04431 [Akanthomyces lecanii]
MKTFRLLNTATWAVEVFEIGQAPPYLAVSHAWSDAIFPRQLPLSPSFGSDAIAQTIHKRGLHHVRYCWIDLFCIIQDSDEDICDQIPLMSHIYGDAQAVLIVLTNKLNLTQEQVDRGTAQLDEALAIWREEAWTDEGVQEYCEHGRGRGTLVQAMSILARFTNAAWGTRVWTLQEYLLATTLVWIGADLEPISIRDELFVAIPRFCEELDISECARRGDPATNQYELLFSHFSGMAARRTGAIDRTRVMEMLGNREAFLPVDEVYGAMAVSTVEISIRPKESRESAWRRWTEAALAAGHLRWLLLPPSMRTEDAAIGLTCAEVVCSGRHLLSSASGLDAVTPYGPVTVEGGTVTVTARRIGHCTVIRKLGPVLRGGTGWVHRDMTLILYAEGAWPSAIDIAVAFGAGRYSNKQLIMIAQTLANNYDRALRYIRQHMEAKFRPIFPAERYFSIWADFVQLQAQCVMDTLNFGVAYLIRIQCLTTQIPVLTVLVTNGRCPEQEIVAFDCNARGGDGRPKLLICERPELRAPEQSGGSATPWHKVGVTIAVGEDYAYGWDSIPLDEIRIGGSRCQLCKGATALETNSQPSTRTPRQRKHHSVTIGLRLRKRRRGHVRNGRISKVIKFRIRGGRRLADLSSLLET